LHEANLEYLLLKGPALALTVYSNPSQRASYDIDILVAFDDIEPACGALEAIGYRLHHSEISASRYRMHHFHWVFRSPSGSTLDLHWNLSKPRDYFRFDPRAVMDHARVVEICGIPVRVPSDLDQFLHAAAQATQGAFLDLRRALDSALLLKHGDINGARLVELAHQQGLASALWSLLWQQSRLTGVAVPPKLERSLRPRAVVRRSLETLANPDELLNRYRSPIQATYASLSMAFCAPHVRAAGRVIRHALLPGAAEFLGYRDDRADPPNPGRRAWTAFKRGVRLTEAFGSLCWRALRIRSAR
jgi:hypothetical protein